jgi:hypothetical protein
MGWFLNRTNTGVGSHDAVVSSDRSKTNKERLVNRVGSIKTALEGPMPQPKRENLKAELRSILLELDAREEAVETIMARFED